jgi:hypothetical protein
MINTSQAMYDGNQPEHHLSEKNSADAVLNMSNANKFETIVIASPTNPIILYDFIFLRVC